MTPQQGRRGEAAPPQGLKAEFWFSVIRHVCPLGLAGSDITAALPVRRGAAAEEAAPPRLAPRDQNAPIDLILKTQLLVHPIKILLDPATKSHPRGETGCDILSYSL